MYRLFLLVLTAALIAGCSRKRDDIISVATGDAEMKAAIARAQGTLNEFWQQRAKDGKHFGGLLKVYFKDEADAESGEHMWVKVTKRTDSEISGILLDEPGWLKTVKSGDHVHFSLDRISDWLYVVDGKAHGAYTVNLLRRRMTPEERAKHDANYPFKFD